MNSSLLSSWAEATMLVCFGLAWPVATLRLLIGRADGTNRGLGFTALILLGYVAGATSKLLTGTAPVPPLFWLYLLNACSVSAHLATQWFLGASRARRGFDRARGDAGGRARNAGREGAVGPIS